MGTYFKLAWLSCIVAGILLFRSASSGPAGGETVSFFPRIDAPAGTGPYGVAMGDFNGDGVRDLVVADISSNAVSVLLGNGDGTFRAPLTFATGTEPMSVAVADFNGDGAQDFVVTNAGSNSVSVWLGNGDGTFRPPLTFTTGRYPASVAVADFNRDGVPDLAVASLDDGAVSVLLADGDGTFKPPVNFPAGTSPFWVAVGDFNGDGVPDLVAVDWYIGNSQNVAVLLGNGDGTFQPALTAAAGTTPRFVTVGDLNGDGVPDLAVVNEESHNVSVLVGNGDGTFRPAVNLDAGPGPWSVAVADLNRDGVPDLVVANQSSATVSVLQGNGDGTFQAALTFAVGQTPRFVVAGDFNGDGVPDLAVTNYQDSTVTVLINNTPPPDTIWSKPVNATATRDSLRKVTGCDGCFDAGASSKPQIDSGDGYAEFTAGEKTFLRVAGLTHAFTGLDPDTIDFGIRLQSGFAEIRENGAYRADTTFEADDVFRITVQSGVVSYSKNGVVFYTSTAAPTYPLVFGAALASLNATVSSLVVSAF